MGRSVSYSYCCLRMLLGAGVLSVASSLLATASAAGAGGPVVVAGVQFYSGRNFHVDQCKPAGPASSTFANSIKRIYASISFSDWEGKHRVRFRWYAPSGKLYHAGPVSSFSDSGPTSICNYLAVAGHQAEDLLGRWTFRLYIDRHPAATGYFTLAGTGGPVKVESVQFYSGRRVRCTADGCNPIGPSSTTFSNKLGRIYAFVRYANWQGTHRDRYQWFSPEGKLILNDRSDRYTAHGRTTGWDYLPVAGTSASTHLGRWTLHLLVDGRFYRARSFRLVEGKGP